MWQQVYSFDLIFSSNPVAIPYLFATDDIVVGITSTRGYGNGHQMGLIWIVTDIPNVGTSRSRPIKVYLTNNSITAPRVQGRAYSLEFLPFPYISYLNLKFWEDLADRYILDSNPPPTASSDSSSANTTQNNNYLSGRSAGLF